MSLKKRVQDVVSSERTARRAASPVGLAINTIKSIPTTLKSNTLKESLGEQAAKGIKGSFKKGGTVKSTGVYKLHKGEKVVPAKKKKKKFNQKAFSNLHKKMYGV